MTDPIPELASDVVIVGGGPAGLTAAYELANAWLATDGQAGLPAVRLGRSILVPRAAIDRLAAVGSGERPEAGLAG